MGVLILGKIGGQKGPQSHSFTCHLPIVIIGFFTLLAPYTAYTQPQRDTTAHNEHCESLLAYPGTTAHQNYYRLHNTVIADPYHWLETASADTEAWAAEQNDTTHEWFTSSVVHRKIAERARALIKESYPRLHQSPAPYYYLGHQYAITNNQKITIDGREYGSLERTEDNGNIRYLAHSFNDTDHILISPNGRRVAYEVSLLGTDKRQWRVLDLQSDTIEILDYADSVLWGSILVADTNAKKQRRTGLFFSRGDSIYFLPVGFRAEHAIKVYDDYFARGNRFQTMQLHKGNNHNIIITTRRRTDSETSVSILHTNKIPPLGTIFEETSKKRRIAKAVTTVLVPNFFDNYSYIGPSPHSGYNFLTTHKAPTVRVMNILNNGQTSEVIPADPNATIINAYSAHGFIFAEVLTHDGRSVLRQYDALGLFAHNTARLMKEYILPCPGRIHHFNIKSPHLIEFSFSSLGISQAKFTIDLSSQSLIVTQNATTVTASAINATLYNYKILQVPTHDNKFMPMILITKQGSEHEQNTQRPVLMYGYGGFGNLNLPHVSPLNSAWIKAGGTVALPFLRGGFELGVDWHSEARTINKQNTFNDAISAAEFLINNSYTTPGKIGLVGSSNGGLLVGATLIQRPDLFGAGIAMNGVFDMLRYQSLPGSGAHWIGEYGNVELKKDFMALHQYSPVHNIKPGTPVPPLLLLVSNNDDIVAKSHSYKFLATLQNNAVGGPYLLRKVVEAGHIYVLPNDLQDSLVESFVFLARHLGLYI